MKKLYLILIIITAAGLLTSCVSSIKYLDSPPPKFKNVQNESDKNSNYIKANEWMVNVFSNAESVIQFTDKEEGIVKGKYAMKKSVVSTSQYGLSQPAFYSIITIRVKNGASRIEIVPPSGMFTQTDDFKNEYGFTPSMFNKDSDKLILSFENHMLGESANDNW